jgi:hypothetical protein
VVVDEKRRLKVLFGGSAPFGLMAIMVSTIPRSGISRADFLKGK